MQDVDMSATVPAEASSSERSGPTAMGTIGFDAYLATVAQRTLGWQPELAERALKPQRVPTIIEEEDAINE